MLLVNHIHHSLLVLSYKGILLSSASLVKHYGQTKILLCTPLIIHISKCTMWKAGTIITLKQKYAAMQTINSYLNVLKKTPVSPKTLIEISKHCCKCKSTATSG
jgi:hypothetical protein